MRTGDTSANGAGRGVLRFELLGPLRAWLGDESIALGPVQQRAVLAVLLLSANQSVGRQQLINAIWGSAAPAYAVNLVQKHVSALRRLLEPDRSRRTPSRLLSWTDNGYLLTIAPGRLDTTGFEREVARARTARATGDLPVAAEALRGALELCRGPLCDGLTGPLIEAAREAFAEQRITVLERRIEADLALGTEADLVGELRRLLAEHPLRERLHGLLMQALDSAGRRTDALAAFRDARRLLRDDLGVEPGAELQQLHRRLLADADEQPAEPLPTAVAPVAPSLPRPSQLPRASRDFVGRAGELAELDALLADVPQATMVAAVIGTAGVGKTALAVHWAHSVSDRFPDGQLYVNLRGFDPIGAALDPGEAIRGFLDAFAVPPQLIPVGLEAQAALYRSLLAGSRVLVVLDNARAADQVRPLLPGSPGCLAVVTSRDSLIGLVAEGARAVPVDLLSPADAKLLLRHRLGSARIDADPQAVHDLTVACARLPLALSIVAARVAAHSRFPLAVLADQIRRAPSGLDAFDGPDPATDVRAVLSWSYRTLSEPSARLFRLLGLHPGPDTDIAAAASLAGVPVRGTAAALAELTRAHLIAEHQPGRYLAHDLVRTYAAEQAERLDPDPETAAALRRLLDHYLHSAHLADRLVNPHRDPVQPPEPLPGVVVAPLADAADAVAWFAAEHAALVAGVTFAAAEGFDTHAWQLVWGLTTYFDRAGLWHDGVEVQQTALAAARRTGDPRAVAWADRNLARVYVRLGHPDDAERHLRHALLLNEQIGDLAGQARTHLNLARVAEDHDRPDTARRHVERALELFREAGNPVGQADALNAAGWYEARRGALDEALEHCEQALALNRKTGDREGEAHTWDSLGLINHERGAATPALDCYVRAVALWRELGDRYCEADTLVRLGDAYQSAGEPAAARARWREAIALMQAYGHPDLARIEAKLREPSGGLSPADGRQGQR